MPSGRLGGGYFGYAQTDVNGVYATTGVPLGAYVVTISPVESSTVAYSYEYDRNKPLRSRAQAVMVNAGGSTAGEVAQPSP